MRNRSLLAIASVTLLALLAACGGGDDDQAADDTGGDEPTTSETAGDAVCDGEVTDLLAEICEKGTLTGVDRPGLPAAVLARTSRPASTTASTSTSPPRSPTGSASTSPGRRQPGT